MFSSCRHRGSKLGYRTTALEALQGADLTGRTALVTGGNTGLGLETCRALAAGGAHVVLCSRSLEAGQAAAEQIRQEAKGRISVCQLDLADLRSIQALAAQLASSGPSPDLLILNAGVMALSPGPQRTADGFEMQFGVNHLGHFLLCQLLLPKMKAQGTPGRIVVVSSRIHERGRIDLQDLNYKKRPYRPWASYAQSKLANVLFTRELARRLREEGSALEVYCLHPGIVQTNIGSHMGLQARSFYLLFAPWLKTPEQGAATTVYAATAAELTGHSGAYLQDCRLSAPAKRAESDALAAALWAKSAELVEGALQRAALSL
ncbi:hypothetical protein ABPG77_011363 [Micractinium sp. CCAP 211/92]